MLCNPVFILAIINELLGGALRSSSALLVMLMKPNCWASKIQQPSLIHLFFTAGSGAMLGLTPAVVQQAH